MNNDNPSATARTPSYEELSTLADTLRRLADELDSAHEMLSEVLELPSLEMATAALDASMRGERKLANALRRISDKTSVTINRAGGMFGNRINEAVKEMRRIADALEGGEEVRK